MKYEPFDLALAEAPLAGGGVLLRIRHRPQWFLLCFAVAWDLFLGFWYTGVSAAAISGKAGFALLLPLLFPLAHVAVGIFMTRSALAGLFNTTRVRISNEGFECSEGPIPALQFWNARISVPLADVDGFELSSETSSGRSRSTTWDVRVLLRSGKFRSLSVPIRDAADGEAIRDRLNDALALAKMPTTYR